MSPSIAKNQSKKSRAGHLLWLAALLLIFCFPVKLFAKTVIYFYDPDANLRDIAKLKSSIQDYFRGIDPSTELTAFVRLQDLLNSLKSRPPDFLVSSSWFNKNYSAQYGLKSLLSGRLGSERTYTKVLISKKTTPLGESPTLSMVSLGEKGQGELAALVPELRKFQNLSVVEVNKDIDAVLAVAFDQVDMALVREQNIATIRKVNEPAISSLRVLGHSNPIEYPIFSASSKTNPELVEKFVKMLQSPSKPNLAVDLMGFDRWGPRE